MNSRHHPLFWSFSLGTWYATQLRLSPLFPLVGGILWWQTGDGKLAAAYTAVLLLSVLFHEVGHVLAARSLGGSAGEILLWPLGGLAVVEPPAGVRPQVLMAAAGPLVNLVVCVLLLPGLLSAPHWTRLLNPLELPAVALAADWLIDWQVLGFAVNWLLLLVNLLPIYPLDGGRMLQCWMSGRWGAAASLEMMVRVGYVAAGLMVLAGLMTQEVWLVALALVLLVFAMQEHQRFRSGELYDESVFGYDFSQGYTSLERSQPRDLSVRLGFWQRWRMRREEEKRRREQIRQEEAELELDKLLEKLHAAGMAGLTDAEKHKLREASARYRGKGKSAT